VKLFIRKIFSLAVIITAVFSEFLMNQRLQKRTNGEILNEEKITIDVHYTIIIDYNLVFWVPSIQRTPPVFST
jgi:hypothetical protein